MNCQTTRQTLEYDRPADLASAAVETARRHVEECAECQMAVEEQRQFDDHWGAVCRDVAVPAGLKERLLAISAPTSAAVAPVIAPVIAPATSAASKPANTRATIGQSSWRRWLISTAIALCGMVAVALWWELHPQPERLSLDQIVEMAMSARFETVDPSTFAEFQNGLKVRRPETMLTSPLTEQPHQLRERDVAIYFFHLYDRTRRPVEGRLIVLPKSALVENLTATTFQSGLVPSGGVPYRASVWVEKDYVYLCYLSGGDDLVLALQPQPV